MSAFHRKDGIFTYSPPPPPPFVRPSPPSTSVGPKISPAVLFIIVILAVLFFISGLLHLLVRFLIKTPSSGSSPPSADSRRYPELSTSDALQRQLQQLFHLHDSGLNQSFIDALPVFQYKEVVGAKEPFDCAVCLCEFSDKDKLRLLPVCSHAFHINCIDTWLLSNSTCPLCRGTLFAPGLSIENPIFDYDDFRDEDGAIRLNPGQKTVDIEEAMVVEKKALPVRLGKFRKLNNDDSSEPQGGGETSSSNLDARRCFSMGSYQYVVVDADLRVPFSHGQDSTTSKRMETGGGNSLEDRDVVGKKINKVAKGESYSVSKIWLWPKKGKYSATSEEQTGNDMPSSLKIDLPWAEEPSGK